MPSFSKSLESSLHRALEFANERNHEFATLEHLLAALIDLTGLYTLLMLGTRAKATADLRIDYHRPAIAGPLIARGQVVKNGRQISVAEARIFGPDDKLLASGRGAYIC